MNNCIENTGLMSEGMSLQFKFLCQKDKDEPNISGDQSSFGNHAPKVSCINNPLYLLSRKKNYLLAMSLEPVKTGTPSLNIIWRKNTLGDRTNWKMMGMK